MICVSIAHISFKDFMSQVSDFEMIELRLDLLDFTDQQYHEIFRLGKPTIATYRYGTTEDSERISALKNAIKQGAKFVDIEIDASEYFMTEMMNIAKQNNCKTILSFHNFKVTPDVKMLNKIIEKSKMLNGDYVKIATMINSKDDLARILSLYENNDNLIAFGMGVLGRVSRVACLYLGADFSYVSIEGKHRTAQGQLTVREMNSIVNII